MIKKTSCVILAMAIFCAAASYGEGVTAGALEGFLFSEGICPVWDTVKKKCGYIDPSGKWVIEPAFEQASPFYDNLAKVVMLVKESPVLVFIDRQGKSVVDPSKYKSVMSDFSEGCAPVYVTQDKKQNVFGFIDKKGKLISRLRVDYLWGITDGLAPFWANRYADFGYANKSGTIVIDPAPYKFGYGFSENFAIVQTKKFSYTVIDAKGAKVSDLGQILRVVPQSHKAGYRSGYINGRALIERAVDEGPSIYQFIDKTGKVLSTISPGGEYSILFVSDGLLGIEKTLPNEEDYRPCAFYAEDGTNAFDAEFVFVGPYSEGLAAVVRDGKLGFINREGEIVIELQYALRPIRP